MSLVQKVPTQPAHLQACYCLFLLVVTKDSPRDGLSPDPTLTFRPSPNP